MFKQHEYQSQRFEKLDHSYEELNDKRFDDCTFIDCNFSEATFDACQFIDCHFIRCNLNLVQLGYSQLRDVRFEHCKLLGIDWTRVNWPNFLFSAPVQFDQCLLSEGSFYGLKLNELQMLECKAHNLDLREADLSDADLSHTDFTGAQFHNTNLSNANFAEAIAYDINIFNNPVKGAKFSRFEATSLLESLEIELLD
ncbi:pentapeptide repeat-containing protein [Ferrimonas pelagia]|uniref:Pentapeptide repeat-containing protein n=1 Tax=Ferrimonas pelagia TaxID=1177826 RepID=A0ABP9EEZ4_9GAMM